MNKIQITPEIKILELLQDYPELEDKLITLAPPFKKLKNPILLKTIGKVTTLRQVSKVSEISLGTLINELRAAAGQNEIKVEENKSQKTSQPGWINEAKINMTYDARIDLENGNHPAAKVTKEILTLEGNDLYLLITPFFPGPLVDIIKDKGFETYSLTKSADEVHTFIKKKL